jgi:hypothetical protein
MSEATCAVLSAIFPLILVTGVLERRVPHIKIRRHQFYRLTFLATFTAALAGTICAVVGVQIAGLSPALGATTWVLFAVAIGGLATTLIASVATAEIQEDSDERGDRD